MSTQIDLLKKYGLPIRGHSGQHLLIDPNTQRKIVDALDPQPNDKILEIGPGLGALTYEILRRGANVLAVEKDERFIEILRGEAGKDYRGRLEVLNQDILKFKLDSLKGKEKWKVISNLPYYITAPILFHLIESRQKFSKAVFTMQKEVAERLVAAPGSKDYGRLTLGVRYSADVRLLFDISKTCFTPKPEVDSSVVELVFHPQSKIPEGTNEKFLFDLIQIAFNQRRKTLFHVLSHEPRFKTITREQWTGLFAELGFEPKIRGEQLLLKDYMALAKELEAMAPQLFL